MTKEGNDQEEKVFTKVEHEGVIKDLQGERDKRQRTEYDLDTSRRENESLKKTIADAQAKSDEKVELASDKIKFSGEDDDPATVKDVKLGFKSLEKEATAKFKAAQKAGIEAVKAEAIKEKFDQSCLDATDKYSKLASIGLDFRTVYQAAIKRIGRNKYEELAIFHSKNPGEALYKKGSEDPEIKAKLDLEENQELLKSMDSRKVDKSSLGGVSVKSDEFFTPQEVTDMSTKEAVENMPKVEKSRKYWAEQRKKK